MCGPRHGYPSPQHAGRDPDTGHTGVSPHVTRPDQAPPRTGRGLVGAGEQVEGVVNANGDRDGAPFG